MPVQLEILTNLQEVSQPWPRQQAALQGSLLLPENLRFQEGSAAQTPRQVKCECPSVRWNSCREPDPSFRKPACFQEGWGELERTGLCRIKPARKSNDAQKEAYVEDRGGPRNEHVQMYLLKQQQFFSLARQNVTSSTSCCQPSSTAWFSSSAGALHANTRARNGLQIRDSSLAR